MKKNDDDVKQLDNQKPSRDDLINSLDNMVQAIENLPPHARIFPVNQYDMGALISLLVCIFRSEKYEKKNTKTAD